MPKYTELVEHNERERFPAPLNLANQENLAMAQGQFIGKISSGRISWFVLIFLYLTIGLPYLAVMILAIEAIQSFGQIVIAIVICVPSIIYQIPFIIAVKKKIQSSKLHNNNPPNKNDAPEAASPPR